MVGICSALNAQVTDSLPTHEKTYDILDQMPEYPGGPKALYEFLFTNLQYPAEALKNEIEGIVYLKFIVDKNGIVSNPVVVRSLGSGCDEEALRIISLMPKWNPGVENGKPVAVWYSLPVKFTIIEAAEEKSHKKKGKD